MKLDSVTWSQIAELFDSLVDLSPEQRRRFLEETAPPDDIRRKLDRLLEAHDHPDPLLLDQSVDDIVFDMLGDGAASVAEIPTNLAGRHFGNWQATEEIGRGGMSVVLRGKRADGQFEKETAIKLLAPGPVGPARRARFQSELRLLARLEHPGIARLLDGGVSEEDMPYLVMEHVSGMSITRYAEEHRLNLEQRVRLFMQAAEAVAYSHQQLIVHCDIKPGNVLVTDDDQVKLVDFGIAALLSDQTGDDPAAPIPHCSPAYAAPEQLLGEAPTVAQDVFGLGAVFHELITGRRIRDMRNATGVLFGRAVKDRIRPPSEVSALPRVSPRQLNPDLDAICMKALASDPGDRYTSVGTMLADIANWRKHRPVEAVAGGGAYRTRKWLQRNRWLASVAGIIALSISTGAALAVWQAREARDSAELARLESARAEMALAEAEQALERSEALRDFLLNLFRSAQPNRPREQLPDTETLLALGAEQALDEGAAPPGERFEMLMAIGSVYFGLNRFDDARPLFETAITLAGDHPAVADDDHAYALAQLASLEERLGQYSDAISLLDEAETIINKGSVSWETTAQVRDLRGAVKIEQGEPEEALRILAPLNEALSERPAVSARIRGDIKRDLGSAHRYLGNLEEAAELRTEVIEIFRESLGTESLDYGISLINSGIIEHTLGNYELAEGRAREALALFDRIFEEPNIYSAATYGNLGLMLYYQGRFDEALEATDRGIRQRAEVSGRDTDTYDQYYYRRGAQLASMRRWNEAETALSRARELFARNPDTDPGEFALLESHLARAQCNQNDLDGGQIVLADMMERLGGELPANPKQHAAIHEAHATCAFRSGELNKALEAIDRSLAVEADAGQAPDIADSKLLRARILHAMGREDDAVRMLDEAEALYRDLGLDEHPHLTDILATRRDMNLDR